MFGWFDPDYPRNRVLVKGLAQNGVTVKQCRVAPGRLGLVKLFFRYLTVRKDFDWLWVAFPGQEVMFLARLLTGRPIVFDAFTSHYGGYILDRQHWPVRSWRARYYRWLDRWSCRLADLILLDTQAHIDFFVREFGLPREKFRRLWVGADSAVFRPALSLVRACPFTVHFHGSYVPLQGVEYIIRAAKLLENEPIQFNLIGRGQTYLADRQLAENLAVKNINFIDNMPYEKLPDYLAVADITLGIFGASPKTTLVIPNKIYEALAMAKAIITADTPAARELLTDRENVLFCRAADPTDLAAKLLELRNNAALRHSIATNAHQLFQSQLTEAKLGKALLAWLF